MFKYLLITLRNKYNFVPRYVGPVKNILVLVQIITLSFFVFMVIWSNCSIYPHESTKKTEIQMKNMSKGEKSIILQSTQPDFSEINTWMDKNMMIWIVIISSMCNTQQVQWRFHIIISLLLAWDSSTDSYSRTSTTGLILVTHTQCMVPFKILILISTDKHTTTSRKSYNICRYSFIIKLDWLKIIWC